MSDSITSTLKQGLYLEDYALLLPWGSRLTQLMCLGNPRICRDAPAWKEIHWEATRVFGGLDGQLIEVILFPYGWFDSALIQLEKTPDHDQIQSRFFTAYDHLSTIFGATNPLANLPDGSDYDYRVAWQIDCISISLLMRCQAHPIDALYTCQLSVIHSESCGSPASDQEKRAGWER